MALGATAPIITSHAGNAWLSHKHAVEDCDFLIAIGANLMIELLKDSKGLRQMLKLLNGYRYIRNKQSQRDWYHV